MTLTPQQRKYAESRFAGLGKKASALAAGCPEKSAAQAASRLEKHSNVVMHLAKLKGDESDKDVSAGRDPDPPGKELYDEFFDDPKDFLKQAMNDRDQDLRTRLQAAIALMPFEHLKLKEGGVKDTQKSNAKDAAGGRFAPKSVPSQLRLVGNDA